VDPKRFEEMSRRFAAATTRRTGLRVLAAGAATAALGAFRREEAAAGVPIFHCKLPGQKCKNDDQCCTEKCRKNQCQCKPKGKACYEPLRSGLCCSGKCQKGKCT
jgi:hypothetical protein